MISFTAVKALQLSFHMQKTEWLFDSCFNNESRFFQQRSNLYQRRAYQRIVITSYHTKTCDFQNRRNSEITNKLCTFDDKQNRTLKFLILTKNFINKILLHETSARFFVLNISENNKTLPENVFWNIKVYLSIRDLDNNRRVTRDFLGQGSFLEIRAL